MKYGHDIIWKGMIIMRLLINKKDLALLLEQKRDYIGNYNHTKLMKDIEDLDMIQHKHSLIVIKRNKNQKASKFLLYYDEEWDCKLFLNCKTADRNNEQNIIKASGTAAPGTGAGGWSG